MKKERVSVAVKTIENCRTLLDYLNVFYVDKSKKRVKDTTSFFANCRVMEKFWDWLDAQEISNDKIKFLIADIAVEKKKYLLKNSTIKIEFNDAKDYDYDESTIDYYDDDDVYQYN